MQPRAGIVAGDTFATVMVLAHCNQVHRKYTQTLQRECHLLAHDDDIALHIVAPPLQSCALQPKRHVNFSAPSLWTSSACLIIKLS